MAHVLNFPASATRNAPSGFFARISTAVANYRLYRKTIEELRSLSTRELQDLGLSRYAIRQVAYDSVYN